MAGKRRCLTIGVAQAGDLVYLGGAITAAEEIGEWARRSQFDSVEVLTDRDHPVTMSDVEAALTSMLTEDGSGTEVLILYFAGHGYRQSAEQHVWLLSDWEEAQQAIAVDALKIRLHRYGVRHLAIFSDACRSMPDRAAVDYIDKVGVLRRGPWQAIMPEVDRFNAVQDGAAAFMIPGPTPEQSRCIFSGAVMEGLLGDAEACTGAPPARRVTSEQLALFLRDRVPVIGERYRLTCSPETHSGIPGDHIVYFDESAPPDPLPELKPWPEPSPTIAAQAQGIISPKFDLIVANVSKLRRVLGPEFGRTHPEIEPTVRLRSIPEEAREPLERLALARLVQQTRRLSERQRREIEWRAALARLDVENVVAAERRRANHDAIVEQFGRINLFRHPNADLILLGVPEARVHGDGDLRIEIAQSNTWAITLETDRPSTQLLIENSDGTYTPVTIMSDLMTIVARDEHGISRVVMAPKQDLTSYNYEKTLDAIAMLDAGTLTASSIDRLAVDMRMEKHGNPVLGVIAAYLYDYAGDVDSIRRMAWFYAKKGQAIPYDIAFLGMLKTAHDHRGVVRAIVPAVPARGRDGRGGRLPKWVTRATDERTAEVAGSCPWLRQGWSYMDNPEDVELPMIDRLGEVRREILPSSFTSLTPEGGRHLAHIWGML